MVDAKRRRNEAFLRMSGLLDMSWSEGKPRRRSAAATSSGRPKKKPRVDEGGGGRPRRTSSRIAGKPADGAYVEDERAGRFTIATSAADDGVGGAVRREPEGPPPPPQFYAGRINDGSDISIREAVNNVRKNFLNDDDEEGGEEAARFVKETLRTAAAVAKGATPGKKKGVAKTTSPVSVLSVPSSIRSMAEAIGPEVTTKVTPERIYSTAVHPGTSATIVAAGDKQGHVGIWNVDGRSDGEHQQQHLFRYHASPVSCLEWTATGDALFSVSYDGTCRWFDVERETVREAFAAYDDSREFRTRPGYGVDTGGREFWTQHGCLDRRCSGGGPDGTGFFLSTSVGTALHVDARANRVTFHEKLSERKINTVRYVHYISKTGDGSR
jgi:hypothetical protein